MTAIGLLPSDDSSNGWSRILPGRTPRPPLRGERRCHWVVVGAGFAGLAAAHRLAENRPNDEVLLLEAQAVGEGASGRNSGFAIDLPHNVGSALAELEGSQRFMRLARAGIGQLEHCVERYGIDCDWARRGKYHAAVSEAGVREILEPFVRELEALGEPYRWIDRAALRGEIGTPWFAAAVHTPGCVLMNPAALTRGLADSLPANVALHEGSPVVAADYGDGIRLSTPEGSVVADHMILAVNGLAERFGFFQGRLLNFAAQASLTRPLSESECRDLGGTANWGLTPVNGFAGVTMRFTADRRILIRQSIRYRAGLRAGEQERAAARRHHLRLFRERFPMLPAVGLEHTWTGFVCLSRNHAPGFGRVAPRVTAAVCQNAIGVAKGTISGLLAADLASGRDNPLIADMEGLGAPAPLMPRPFLDLGVRARLAWELWSARAER